MDFSPDLFSRSTAMDERTESSVWEIGSAVLTGLLLEVSAWPKPGLVAPRSMGAHRDMDLQTFMLSSAAIAPALYACARAGLAHEGAPEALLPVIRAIGRDFDPRLLFSTHGVNTQRGALFCAGLLAAAAGAAAQEAAALDAAAVFAMAGRITQGLSERELVSRDPSRARTNGEILYRDYGVLGIRGEVEAGFPSVAFHGLPALRTALAEGHGLNHALVHTLMVLIAETEDTTILWRGGPEGLAFLQGEAVRILSLGGALSEAGRAEIERLSAVCVDRRLSPGGAADLLAVTAAVYLLEHRRFPESAMIKSHDPEGPFCPPVPRPYGG